ncbi:MAG TPA: FAD-dependent oxidoreductase [Thermoleophilia bacterium]|nr:FAD-dependent oxidoreductase [Thermoleophilia bacterium]
MSLQPVILVVDDDMTSLTITEQELRKRYGRDYRVLARQSAAAALDELRRLKIEGQPVALILADQVMPEMSGPDFLGEARVIDPVAKRVMLVSWGDRSAPQAILTGCAVGQIEFFITKPWHTATDERFHSEVAGFLYEWARLQRPVYEAVRIVGERWAPRSHELRDLLGRNGVAYGFYDADSGEGREILRDAGLDAPPKLPVAVVFGGRVLVDPSNREVSESLGVRSRPSADECDLLVVGAGPAGLAAAVYGSSEGLSTVVLEREALGGQAGQSTMIHNYLGFPAGISGDELTFRAYEQAWQFGAEFLFSNEATSLRPDGDAHMIELADGASLRAGAVILATGVTYRRLAVPRLDPFRGSGVFYGSVSSEARSLVNMDVYIVGGGNSAGQAAIHLAKYARHVTLVMRGDGLSDTMSHYLVSFLSNVDRISLRPRTLIVDGDGDTRLRRLTLEQIDSGEREVVPADALFVMIGADPHTEWLPPEIARDAHGFVLTGPDILGAGLPEPWPLERLPLGLETSLPGVFAAGDVRADSVKRVASAVGEGAVAVRLVQQHLAARQLNRVA